MHTTKNYPLNEVKDTKAKMTRCFVFTIGNLSLILIKSSG